MVASDFIVLIAFSLAWWLGLYLLARDLRNPQLRFTGLGLAIYALALGAYLLATVAPEPEVSTTLARWGWPLLFLPALFWAGALFYLLPETAAARRSLDRIVSWGLPLLAILLYLLTASTELIFTTTSNTATGLEVSPGPWYGLLVAEIVIFMLIALLLLGQAIRAHRPPHLLGLIVAATLFFGLGLGLLLLPSGLLPQWFLILGIGLDMALLGLAIALLDALGQGESLLPDFFRSLAFSFFTVLIFAGQVALVMALATGVTLAMVVLLLATILTAITVQTFADPIQDALDWLIFSRIPRIRQARADSRVVASAISRSREVLDPATLTDDQFTRLTRQALSQMGNLPRLAASPLTRLQLIERRLSTRSAQDNTLERAAELKHLLSDSINQLKPRGQGDFGTVDARRYYNALYFPYVAGLKPYGRRAIYDDLDSLTAEALDWFQVHVPERTLHNWQTAAARLIAQNLREMSS